jgi:tRNA (mo5U34)-methyltransferase
MIRSAGFKITQHPEKEVYICRRTELPNNRAHTVWMEKQ